MPGRLLLVLPFDNRTDQPNLDWISDAIPEVLNRRLASAGFMPISRDDRLYALDHLGLPSTFQPSRASAIRLAQTLDANYVIVGSFSTTGYPLLKVQAQILNMDALHLSAPIEERGGYDAFARSAQQPLLGAGQANRSAIRGGARIPLSPPMPELRIDAFENYIRGLVETDPTNRFAT